MQLHNAVFKWGFSALVCGFSIPIASCTKTHNTPPWLQLSKAYPSRNDKLIRKYTKSHTQSVRLYATALQDLAERDYKALPKDGEACTTATIKRGADAAAYLGCLFAVRSGLAEAHQPKLANLWNSKAIAFYKKHSRTIDKATGSNDPGAIKKLHSPGVTSVKKWPLQTVSVEASWPDIPMQNGTVNAYIDGKPIRMLIDTGSTGIVLSKNDVKHYGLKTLLIPLAASNGVGNHVGGYSSNLYYVKHFHLGPLDVSNAYITIAPNPVSSLTGSAVGMSVLTSLRQFSISANRIGHFVKSAKDICGQMMFTRHPVAEGITRPFFQIPTSAGHLGLILDSGFHSLDKQRNFGVQLMVKEKSELSNSKGITSRKKIKEILMQGGKSIEYGTETFTMSVANVRTKGVFSYSNSPDPMLAGALDFNFLRSASVAYNFPDKEMCIAPDTKQPISDISSQ